MPKSINPLQARRKSSASAAPSPAKRKKTLSLETEQKLDDTGLVPSLAPADVSQDVENLMRYIQAHMFSPMPDRAGGMGSERISEVLRFRETLPRIVSVTHLFALSRSSTATERELAQLVARGTVRRFIVPGRGKAGGGVGEGVVLTEDWKASVRESRALGEVVQEKYIELLGANSGNTTISTTSLSNDEIRELVQAGYLTSPSALSSGLSDLFTRPSASALSGAGSKAATGTLAAVGGTGAVHESGGGGSTLATKDNRGSNSLNMAQQRLMTFSLPSTGPYLSLLTSARAHLLALLKQLSPRYKESTLDLLNERWDGNIPNDPTSRAKRARGEWTGVLPGKTKKWKDFYGLEFDWILAECVGGGVVELFETGSVGPAVRAT